MTWFKSFFEF